MNIKIITAIVAAFVLGVFAHHIFISKTVDEYEFISPLTQDRAEAMAIMTNAALGLKYGIVSDTGSMRPILDSNHFVFYIDAWNKIDVGQIIIANQPNNEHPVIHLVFEKGSGKNGEVWVHTKPYNYKGWDEVKITEKEYVGTYVGGLVFDPKTKR